MPVPTHRDDCQTRIWPSQCPGCGASVYFFSCTCGSRVYMDTNEPPWTLHETTCPRLAIGELFEQENWSAERIRRRVEQESEETGIPVPVSVFEILNDLDGGRRGRRVVEALPAEPTDVVGTVMQINRLINVFQRFSLPRNEISRALLGRLGSEHYTEVTVREDPEEFQGLSFQFTFLMADAKVSAAALRQGTRVRASLRSSVVLTGHREWLAVRVEPIAGRA